MNHVFDNTTKKKYFTADSAPQLNSIYQSHIHIFSCPNYLFILEEVHKIRKARDLKLVRDVHGTQPLGLARITIACCAESSHKVLHIMTRQ